MGRLGGEGTASLRRSGGNAGRGESLCPRRWCRNPLIVSVGRNKIRLQMRRQRSVLFRGPARERWGCRVRTNGMPQDGVATNIVMP